MNQPPQWDPQRNAWVVFDASTQKWVVLAPVKSDNGIKSALAGLGILALIGLAIDMCSRH